MLQDLTYKIVVLDDTDEFYEDYIETAEEKLLKNGYLMKHEKYERLEDFHLDSFEDVDLFLVDLKFGDEDKGPEFIAKIREKYCTDILFYSSEKEKIHEYRLKGEYEGLFFAIRDPDKKKEIQKKIDDLIGKMINRSNTPLATRGIVLGSVAEIDNLVKKKTSELLKKMSSDQVKSLRKKCTKQYYSSFNDKCNKIREFFGTYFHKGERDINNVIDDSNKYDISELIENILITDSYKNLQVLLKCYKTIYEKDDTYKEIEKYKRMLFDRNTLAHVSETKNENGDYQFKKQNKDDYLVLTERKCKELRKSIIKCYNQINSISV